MKMTAPDLTQYTRVKCFGCKQHIHLSRFAGIMKARNGRTLYFCDGLPCLLVLADKTRVRQSDDKSVNNILMASEAQNG
jgi:hypothetical protein